MPVDSRYPTIDIPKVDLWTFLLESKDREFPDNKVIYQDALTSRKYTFAEIKQTALDFGKGLKAVWEWRKGDVLLLFSANCIDTPAITLGTLWTGGIVSPANPAYTAEELAFQLKDAGARAVVTQKPLLDVVVKACQKVGIPQEMIILMGDERDPSARFKHFTSIRNISGATRYRKTKVDPENDLAFLVYSSGTTGLPKGVMLCHRNIVANILQLRAAESGNLSWQGGPDGEGDKILAFLPFYHIYGLTCLVMCSLRQGYHLIVMSKFEIQAFCKTIQDHRITFTYLVPPVLLLIAKHPSISDFDLSSLRMANSGAAPLTKELVEQVNKRVRLPIKQGYGLSETSPTTHAQPWGDWDQTIGSVGKLLPNMQAKYLAPDGVTELKPGETGELAVKGPNVFNGYLNQPKMTEECFTEDGFFRTGDIGHETPDGSFYITDRVKELIKYKGFQVAPAELEGLLVDHPSIDDVAVIGVYEESQHTELPRAYVVLTHGTARSEAMGKEIASWLAGRVAGHKKLRGGVKFVDAIPKSASGKILRRIFKEEAKKEATKAKL